MPFSHLDRARLDRGAEHLHHLGPRALAEMLAQLAARIGGGPAILGVLAEYENLSPGTVRALNANRFPTRRPRAVPADLARTSA